MLNDYPHVTVNFTPDPHLRPRVSCPHPRNCRTVQRLAWVLLERRAKAVRSEKIIANKGINHAND